MSRSESRRRTTPFAVRFAPEELDHLQEQATALGLSLGSLIRGRAMRPDQATLRELEAWCEQFAANLADGGVPTLSSDTVWHVIDEIRRRLMSARRVVDQGQDDDHPGQDGADQLNQRHRTTPCT
jgi:hypothetical protein